MDQLITDVLTFARVGTEAIEPEVVDMSQLPQRVLGRPQSDGCYAVCQNGSNDPSRS